MATMLRPLSRRFSSPSQLRATIFRLPNVTFGLALLSLLFVVYHPLGSGCADGAVRKQEGIRGESESTVESDGAAVVRTEREKMRARIESLSRWKEASYAKRRLSIYVYELPKVYNEELVERSRKGGKIRDPICDENFYSSEVHVHKFLLSSAVRTMNADEADFFYVPIYTTCQLIMLKKNDVNATGAQFRRGMRHVIEEAPYFNRSDGRDHVYLFAQGYSGRLAGDWTRYKNGIFMVHNGEMTAAEYTAHKDFTIPPELRAYLRPVWLAAGNGTGSGKKKYLAQFGGQVVNAKVSDHRGSNYSGGVRQFIQSQLSHRAGYRVTGVRSSTYLEDMRQSRFCLAPEGWHPWSPRPYYSVLMGCIPVVISEVQELAFEEVIDWNSIAIWVRPRDIGDLDRILRAVSAEEVESRVRMMREVWRAFWYAEEGLGNEAILSMLYRRKYANRPRRSFK